jgi:hypothetical protein
VVSKRERQRKTAVVNDLYENKRKSQRWVKISRRELFVYNHFHSLSLSYFSYLFMSFVFFFSLKKRKENNNNTIVSPSSTPVGEVGSVYPS